jgi:hypothetical protein
MAATPWSELPADLASVLRPIVPALSEEIVEAIGREVEDYRRPLEGPFGVAVRDGTRIALGRFVDLIAGTAADTGGGRRFYVGLGEAEFRAGRRLDSLLAAYRLGARLAWRRCAEAGEAAGVDPHVLYRLGEAIFAYIDGLSAESAEGFAQAQSVAAGERQQRRRRLVALLVTDPPAEERAVRAAAQEAGWPLPERLAAVILSGERASRAAVGLGPEAISAPVDEATVALLPDPDAPGRRRELEAVAAGVGEAAPAGGSAPATAAPAGGVAAVIAGPSVPWREATLSLRRAQLAHRLSESGVLAAGPLVVADDHLATLVLHSDPRMAADLAAARLAPLGPLPRVTRDKLTETLRAWLDQGGRVEETARRLDVHPQTVRYRVRKLRGLFGSALDDPDGRFALALALRAAPERT